MLPLPAEVGTFASFLIQFSYGLNDSANNGRLARSDCPPTVDSRRCRKLFYPVFSRSGDNIFFLGQCMKRPFAVRWQKTKFQSINYLVVLPVPAQKGPNVIVYVRSFVYLHVPVPLSQQKIVRSFLMHVPQ